MNEELFFKIIIDDNFLCNYIKNYTDEQKIEFMNNFKEYGITIINKHNQKLKDIENEIKRKNKEIELLDEKIKHNNDINLYEQKLKCKNRINILCDEEINLLKEKLIIHEKINFI